MPGSPTTPGRPGACVDAPVRVAFRQETLLAIRRCRAICVDQEIPTTAPPVSVLRPVRGLDQYDIVTLSSSFSLDYPDYEVIFCCADETDRAVSAIRQLMESNPEIKARLLIGDHGATANPKLNNLSKGWNSAQNDWMWIGMQF